MNRSDQEKLDRLLSDGQGPSAPAREQMLDRILPRVAARSPASGRSLRALTWSGAAAAVLAVAFGIVFLTRGEDQSSEGFAARGGRGAFSARCTEQSTPGTTVRCRVGQKLVFAVDPPQGSASYFSAAALGPGGRLVWYFPAERRPSALVKGGGPMREAIEIGPAHAPGSYRLFGVFSAAPLDKNAARVLIDAAANTGQASSSQVLEIALEVLP